MALSKSALIAATLAVAVSSAARADYITGSLWENNSNTPSIANIPGTAPDVTFTANGVQFSSFGNTTNTGNGALDYTVQSWLTSLAAAHNITYNGSAMGSDSINNSFIELTGVAHFTTGQSFVVAHDDGLEFAVNGTDVINATGPTPPIYTSGVYTGPTGNFSFVITYGECCSAPAVLETNLVPAQNSVPEPATLALLGIGLAGLGIAVGRRRKAP